MKRKLSIAIAFVGNHHVMLLDEPTLGLTSALYFSSWIYWSDIRLAGSGFVPAIVLELAYTIAR